MLMSRATKKSLGFSASALTACPAGSHNILEPGRCNCNAPELAFSTHTLRLAARFDSIRFSRAVLRASASFLGTSSPIPKKTSLGVCPWNAEWGITSLWAVT